MTNQFDLEYFHEPMYEAGLDVLRKLTSAMSPAERSIGDGIEGFTQFTRNYEPADEFGELLPVEAETRYRGTVISDIKPEIVYGTDLPPNYIVCTLGSLSMALVDHLSYQRRKGGGSALFPPDREWLSNQISSLWMTRPNEADCNEAEMVVVGIGPYPDISLGLRRAACASDWNIEYTATKRFAMLRTGCKKDPVMTVPNLPPEIQSDLTDFTDLNTMTG